MDHDEDALERLVAMRAQYSGTRSLNNAVAAYAEYLAWRALGGQRLPQASGEGDIRREKGRAIEVKSTVNPRKGWRLGYQPMRNDYVFVRFDLPSWRVMEAWFLPLPLAKRFATGMHYTVPREGDWKARATIVPLSRY